MKYQRVLYMNKFTKELKSKLRLVSYDKRRSLKGNVYYVSFASDADIEYADRACKRLHNVTLKPFQSRSSVETQYERRFSTRNHKKTISLSCAPLSATPFLSPRTMLSFLPDNNSSFITSQSASLRCTNETLEEHAMRVLGPCIDINRGVTPSRVLQSIDLISSAPGANFTESQVTSNRKEQQQLINNVQSCLSAVKTARQAADDLCQLYRSGIDCSVALTHLFQVHSTAFYLKAATSAHIKDLLLGGIRLSWPDLANNINTFRTDVGHEQLFMAQIASAKHILSKIDSGTSITMSSKLAYQLTKLSH
ncbi:unnamed protein product [Rotaria sp. Silwood2]|nr:unnamed protein product [Rotaria sp. Silwood2]